MARADLTPGGRSHTDGGCPGMTFLRLTNYLFLKLNQLVVLYYSRTFFGYVWFYRLKAAPPKSNNDKRRASKFPLTS